MCAQGADVRCLKPVVCWFWHFNFAPGSASCSHAVVSLSSCLPLPLTLCLSPSPPPSPPNLTSSLPCYLPSCRAISGLSITAFCCPAEGGIEFDASTRSLRDGLCTQIRSVCPAVAGRSRTSQHTAPNLTHCLSSLPSTISLSLSLSQPQSLCSLSPLRLPLFVIVSFPLCFKLSVLLCFSQFLSPMFASTLTSLIPFHRLLRLFSSGLVIGSVHQLCLCRLSEL